MYPFYVFYVKLQELVFFFSSDFFIQIHCICNCSIFICILVTYYMGFKESVIGIDKTFLWGSKEVTMRYLWCSIQRLVNLRGLCVQMLWHLLRIVILSFGEFVSIPNPFSCLTLYPTSRAECIVVKFPYWANGL